MAEFQWYRTPVDAAGTATGDSVLVLVWFGPTAPANPAPYALVIIDANGDGLISRSEWNGSTGGPPGQDRGGPLALFDGAPGGAGNLYSATAYSVGATGLKDGLTTNFDPVDPANLDPSLLCFAAGTPIETPHGPMPVERLRAGDLVVTDAGPAPLRWTVVQRAIGRGPHAPVRFAAGCLGAAVPVWLSPDHRVVVRGPEVELLFGEPAVLVMAKSLVGAPGIGPAPCGPITYVHFGLDRHALVRAAGLEAESFAYGAEGLRRLAARPPAMALAFERTAAGRVAGAPLPCISHAEGRVLAAALARSAPRAA